VLVHWPPVPWRAPRPLFAQSTPRQRAEPRKRLNTFRTKPRSSRPRDADLWKYPASHEVQRREKASDTRPVMPRGARAPLMAQPTAQRPAAVVARVPQPAQMAARWSWVGAGGGARERMRTMSERGEAGGCGGSSRRGKRSGRAAVGLGALGVPVLSGRHPKCRLIWAAYIYCQSHLKLSPFVYKRYTSNTKDIHQIHTSITRFKPVKKIPQTPAKNPAKSRKNKQKSPPIRAVKPRKIEQNHCKLAQNHSRIAQNAAKYSEKMKKRASKGARTDDPRLESQSRAPVL